MGHQSTEQAVHAVSDPAAAAAHRRQILLYAGVTAALIAVLLVLVFQL
ncbi:hypothetical protein AAFP30_22570 [Gordonia sp. CPCC 205515]